MRVCVYVCVFVCKKERKKERKKDRKKEREKGYVSVSQPCSRNFYNGRTELFQFLFKMNGFAFLMSHSSFCSLFLCSVDDSIHYVAFAFSVPPPLLLP